MVEAIINGINYRLDKDLHHIPRHNSAMEKDSVKRQLET